MIISIFNGQAQAWDGPFHINFIQEKKDEKILPKFVLQAHILLYSAVCMYSTSVTVRIYG